MSARKRRTPPSGKVVVGYVRVSTDEQSLGPEAQRAAFAKWCATSGAKLVATHEDLGVSGGSPIEKRPGLLAALGDLRIRSSGVLLVAKRDRLARDVVIAAMIERLVEREGARVLTADGTGNGDGPEAALMRGIVDVFSQYERALIRTRTKAALAIKRTRGERIGEIPFGFAIGRNGRLRPLDAEQAVVKKIQKLRVEGFSIRAIAERLNAARAEARGSRWYPTTVARVLRRCAG